MVYLTIKLYDACREPILFLTNNEHLQILIIFSILHEVCYDILWELACGNGKKREGKTFSSYFFLSLHHLKCHYGTNTKKGWRRVKRLSSTEWNCGLHIPIGETNKKHLVVWVTSNKLLQLLTLL